MTSQELIVAQDRILDLAKTSRELKSGIKRYEFHIKTASVRLFPDEHTKCTFEFYTDKLARAAKQLEAVEIELEKLKAIVPTEIAFPHLLSFFKDGTAAFEKTRNALQLIAMCQEVGFWLPGASRRCRAALSLTNMTSKLFKNWTEDYIVVNFGPVNDLMDKWDNVRPIPTFTSLGVSRLVTGTLKAMNLDLNAESIRVCPIEWVPEEVERDGKKITIHKAALKWPKDTVHGASRFFEKSTSAIKKSGNCHACGHAIKNAFNWVPLLLDDKNGIPHSLWVGRDCARNIFGIDMTGEFEEGTIK